MAEVTLVEAPSTPAGPQVPSGKGEMRVNPGAGGTTTPKPVEPGSSRERLLQRIAKEGGVEPSTLAPQKTHQQREVGDKPEPSATQPKPADKPAPKPEAKPVTQQPKPGDKPGELAKPEGAEEDISDEELAAKVADKTQKTNPWKLVEQYKKKIKAIQTEHESTRALIADEPARKAEVERLTKAEQRAKELEDHIRYVDYSKSQEFSEKYVAPYENAWRTAMEELGGLQHASDETGETYKFSDNDMLELLRLPLTQARAVAEAKWGEYANDVMAQRKEIRGLYDAQYRALEDARKKGGERESQRKVESERVMAEMNKSVTQHWKSHSAALESSDKVGMYFKPVDGDDEVNTSLTSGFELVDKVFAANPMDPSLSPAQREEIVRGHVAMRYRAAAFGAMKIRDQRNSAKIAELEKELAEYRKSTPETTGTTPGGNVPANGGDDWKARMTTKLAAKAR